jgi:glycolate oxidase
MQKHCTGSGGEKMNYNPISPEILAQLQEIVDTKNVLVALTERERYRNDETPGGPAGLPEVVVKPENTAAVAAVLQLSNHHRIPVTVRGQGTGLSGNAVPIHGGIVMSLEKMNKILEIDTANLLAVVEPGVVLLDFRAAVEELGLFYPADPGERSSCIGGNIGTNAGGMNGVKYGKTRDYVTGLEVVLASGAILELGGKTVKRSSGYELMHLIIGSEGTLAIVTRAILKLSPLPRKTISLYIPFDDLFAAARTVAALKRARMPLTAMEIMEQDAILLAEARLEQKMPYNQAPAYLLLRLDGEQEEELLTLAQEVGEHCLANGALDIFVGDTRPAQQKLWDARACLFEALKAHGTMEAADVALPCSQVPEYMYRMKAIGRKYGMTITSFGHAGDGNIHTWPLQGEMPEKEWAQKIPLVMHELFVTTRSLGGALSAEHGIGFTKKAYLPLFLEPAQLTLMKQIKQLFDPCQILNPGKIFDPK